MDKLLILLTSCETRILTNNNITCSEGYVSFFGDCYSIQTTTILNFPYQDSQSCNNNDLIGFTTMA